MEIYEYLNIVKTWASVIGLFFDIVGAVIVWFSVRITIEKANALEEVALPISFDGVGSPENIKENKILSEKRAKERVRASKLALIGLGFFITGFCIQAYGSLPN